MISAVAWAFCTAVTFAKDFCGSPEYKTLTDHGIDTKQLEEASALVLSSDRKRIYMFSDSPEANAYVFVHSAETGLFMGRIDIVGVTNPHYNGGYGDWEAGVIRYCEQDPSKMCILIGDIGHNCVRMDRGRYRMPNQPTRIIEIAEPQADKLSKNRPLEMKGREYHFQYPNGWLFDAEAMVVDNESRLLMITKNTAREYPYVHLFKFPRLSRSTVVTLEHVAIIVVEYSEVTDAANTGEYLALRTYTGIQFYSWDRLHEPSLRAGSGFFSMQWLRDRGELHEGFCFDDNTNRFTFVAEGASKISYLVCPPANPTGSKPPLTRNPAALDDFRHQANPMRFQKGLKDKRCYKTSHERAAGGSPGDPKGKKGKESEKGKGKNLDKGQGKVSDKGKGKSKPTAKEGKPNSSKEGSHRQQHSPSPRGDQPRPVESRQPGTSSSPDTGSRKQRSDATYDRDCFFYSSTNQSLRSAQHDYGWRSDDEEDSDDRKHWRERTQEGYDTNRRWHEKDGTGPKNKVARRRRKKKFTWSKVRVRSRERKSKDIAWQKPRKDKIFLVKTTAFIHFC